ncbi:MAG: hypothetical protein M0P97_01810 [Candidatus Moranbacteria bacterium]|jgi:hypothetical protein|nr:hypothetical protein [Candidatus Moranbacteria bacterium]
MKKLVGFLVVLAMVVGFSGSVFATDTVSSMPRLKVDSDEPANLGFAADPPAGARMDITNNPDGSKTVSVHGMEVYKNNLFLYGDADGQKIVNFVNGATRVPPRYSFNLIFKGADTWHYLHVDVRNNSMPKPWMGDDTCVMPDYGVGASIAPCDWLVQHK